MNYDGTPTFRSSGMQVWLIQFIISELPPQTRYATYKLNSTTIIIQYITKKIFFRATIFLYSHMEGTKDALFYKLRRLMIL